MNFNPQPGDIIYADRGLYKHYGIYSDDLHVIHFAAEQGEEINATNAYIYETTLEKFLKGNAGFVDNTSLAQYSPQEIIRRARANIGTGKGDYNLMFHNCEHFARWCKTGKAYSIQVRNAITTTAAVAGTIVSGLVINNIAKKNHDKNRKKS
ncbi:MAG: lecithin retinol acyltransferase family protein [Treponema sp.]|jgi:hypothetical protein|nr:lecithin retinol acyltransferase family protein [Treponema sp.]